MVRDASVSPPVHADFWPLAFTPNLTRQSFASFMALSTKISILLRKVIHTSRPGFKHPDGGRSLRGTSHEPWVARRLGFPATIGASFWSVGMLWLHDC